MYIYDARLILTVCERECVWVCTVCVWKYLIIYISLMQIHIYMIYSIHVCMHKYMSEKPFREFASFLDGAPRGHVQTLTRRTQRGAGVMQMHQMGQMLINEDACIRK